MNEIYLSPGTPSAPAPVEYENMTDVEKMEWLISDANDSARPHMTDAAHILAAQLVAAEELRDELVRALEGIMALIDNATLVRNVRGDADPNWAIKQLPLIMACKAAQAALVSARTGG